MEYAPFIATIKGKSMNVVRTAMEQHRMPLELATGYLSVAVKEGDLDFTAAASYAEELLESDFPALLSFLKTTLRNSDDVESITHRNILESAIQHDYDAYPQNLDHYISFAKDLYQSGTIDMAAYASLRWANFMATADSQHFVRETNLLTIAYDHAIKLYETPDLTPFAEPTPARMSRQEMLDREARRAASPQGQRHTAIGLLYELLGEFEKGPAQEAAAARAFELYRQAFSLSDITHEAFTGMTEAAFRYMASADIAAIGRSYLEIQIAAIEPDLIHPHSYVINKLDSIIRSEDDFTPDVRHDAQVFLIQSAYNAMEYSYGLNTHFSQVGDRIKTLPHAEATDWVKKFTDRMDKKIQEGNWDAEDGLKFSIHLGTAAPSDDSPKHIGNFIDTLIAIDTSDMHTHEIIVHYARIADALKSAPAEDRRAAFKNKIKAAVENETLPLENWYGMTLKTMALIPQAERFGAYQQLITEVDQIMRDQGHSVIGTENMLMELAVRAYRAARTPEDKDWARKFALTCAANLGTDIHKRSLSELRNMFRSHAGEAIRTNSMLVWMGAPGKDNTTRTAAFAYMQNDGEPLVKFFNFAGRQSSVERQVEANYPKGHPRRARWKAFVSNL